MKNYGWVGTNRLVKNYSATVYNSKVLLNREGVRALCEYVLTPDFLPSLFTDVNGLITSLTIFPFNARIKYNYREATEYDPDTEDIFVGAYKLSFGYSGTAFHHNTDIYCDILQDEYAWFDMGEVYMEREHNNFADFNGYTDIQIWLPYYGMVQLMPNDVVGKYLEFALSVDYNTGQAVYYIMVSDNHIVRNAEDDTIFAGDKFAESRIIATYTFQLGYTIPLGGSNAAEIYRNIVSGIVKIGAIVGGAAVAGALGAGIATTTTTSVQMAKGNFTRTSPNTGRKISPGEWSRDTKNVNVSKTDATNYIKGKAVMDTFQSSAQTLSTLYPQATGDVVNNPALLCNGCEKIRVVIKRPKYLPIDDTYKHDFGVPLGETRTLGNLSGYTEIGEVHIEGEAFSSATSEELARLNETLVSGIIL